MSDVIYKVTIFENEDKVKRVIERKNFDGSVVHLSGGSQAAFKLPDGTTTQPIDYQFEFAEGLTILEAFDQFDEYADKEVANLRKQFAKMIAQQQKQAEKGIEKPSRNEDKILLPDASFKMPPEPTKDG